MEKKIKIKAGNIEAEALLNDSATAQKSMGGLAHRSKGQHLGR